MTDDTFTRRSFLAGSLAVPLLIPALASSAAKFRVAVVGAGAFGGWTALHLLRTGAQVTLIDAWGAGNSRASSGGETRVIRGVYGPTAIYVKWAARSFQLWREAQKKMESQSLFQDACSLDGSRRRHLRKSGYAAAASGRAQVRKIFCG